MTIPSSSTNAPSVASWSTASIANSVGSKTINNSNYPNYPRSVHSASSASTSAFLLDSTTRHASTVLSDSCSLGLTLDDMENFRDGRQSQFSITSKLTRGDSTGRYSNTRNITRNHSQGGIMAGGDALSFNQQHQRSQNQPQNLRKTVLSPQASANTLIHPSSFNEDKKELSRSLGSIPNQLTNNRSSISSIHSHSQKSSDQNSVLSRRTGTSTIKMGHDHSNHVPENYQMYKSNSHSTGVLAGLNQCRLESQLCDVTLLAGDQQFKAHRIVLASCSTFFKELFNTKSAILPAATINSVKSKSGTIPTATSPLPSGASAASISERTIAFGGSASKKTGLNKKISSDTNDGQMSINTNTTNMLNRLDALLNSEPERSHDDENEIAPSAVEDCDDSIIMEQPLSPVPLHAEQGGFPQDYREEIVEVRGVSPNGLKIILNFIYTSELPLSINNIREVLAAGQHMNLKPIIAFCKTFLVKEISVWNCVSIIHIAEQFTLPVVEEKAYEFIALHLNELVKTEEIHKLSFDNMSLLLDSNGLRNVTELELFEAARQWLTFEDARYQYIRNLMEKIRFPQIPPRDLLRFVNFVDFMRLECNYLLLEASNYHMLPHSQPILQSIRTQVRSNDLRMVVVGGVDESDQVSNQIIATNIERTDYLPCLYSGLCSHSVVVLNNFLYVLGGQSIFDERGNTAVATVVRYDPRFNIWMKIASMNEKRAGFSTTVLDGSKIYSLGGVNATGRLSSMECYSMEEDRWRYVASLRTGICDHASTAHGNLLYISGGFKEERFSNSFYAYSPRHDTWHERAPMHVPRGWHCMVTVNDSIFVAGGNAGINKRVDIHETEVYSVLNNQWTIVQSMPLPQSEAGCCIFQNKIFILGGYSWAHQKCVNTIQSYDPIRDAWERPGSLPIELSGLRVTLLTIPYSMTQPINTAAMGGGSRSHSMRSNQSSAADPYLSGSQNKFPGHMASDPVSDIWATADREALKQMQQDASNSDQMNRNVSSFSHNEYSSLPNKTSGGSHY